MPSISWALIASALLGWQDIEIQPSRGDRGLLSFQRSLASLDRPSERTLETLRRHDLDRAYRRDVDYVLQVLEKRAKLSPEADLVYALAELSWVEGHRLDRRRRSGAIQRYIDAVAYAADFLFDPDLQHGREPADPRFRLACEIYNGGLDRLIRATQKKVPIEPGERIKVAIHGHQIVLHVELEKSPWKAADIDELYLASDFEVSGLANRTYKYGLGVPLIAVRHTDHPGKGEDRFYPPEMAFPLTALLWPNSRLRNSAIDPKTPRECTLALVDSLNYRWVTYRMASDQENRLAIESDLTTPLAYMWSHTDLNRYRWAGLLRPGEVAERAGLMLLRPYEPGKIPVVMVHGLISSPLAWIPMINELLNDTEIQKNYQFFLYLYPTGVPLPIAAAGLREALQDAERTFNPGGRDPAFNQMVLLGHSMGGLLSHAMAVNSGNKFWELNSERSFDEIIGPPDVLEELKRYMFFSAQPYVRRVVFLATPHRGSDLSRSVVGRVSSNLISEPDHINSLLTKLIKSNPDTFDRRRFRRLPTSIDTLETDSPILLALLAMTPGEGVIFHSIIGSLRPGPIASTTDGVVSYRSSHLDGVASEKVVRSDHGVQKNPLAIREVQRILHEHLKNLAPAATQNAAVPKPAG
jgi:pimeloyl-ACP methyl ester carboxylesterase